MSRKPKPGAKERRVEFRADVEWYRRVEAAAQHLGISVANFLRIAAVEKMDRDDKDKS